MKYTQLTQKERYHLEVLNQEYSSITLVAKMLGRSKSTISRELRRNKNKEGRYEAENAINLAKSRKQRHIPSKVTYEAQKIIREKLEIYWSPEQISAYLKKWHQVFVSYELIYQYISKDRKDGGTLYKLLPHRGEKYKKRNIKNNRRIWKVAKKRKSINDRPVHISEKKEFGHWEGDTVESNGHRGGVGTFVEMRSKFTIISKVSDKTAESMKKAIIGSFPYESRVIKTLTVDNGTEFALHDQISKSIGVPIFFANSYSPWERGLNENTNGLIRRRFPKGTNFNSLTQREITEWQNLLNERPRKSLGFKTPKEVFLEECSRERTYHV